MPRPYNEAHMPLDDILLDCEEHMEKAVEHLKQELRGVRAGRATPALVEHIRADYYGAQTELRSMASISIPEATQLLIKPFDASAIKHIEKALNDAKLPVTVKNEGKTIRIILPPMSQETRLRLVGQCKTFSEATKVAIRNARRDANKLIETEEKGGIIGEDEAVKGKEQVQELTKTYEQKADDMIEHKKKEILDV